MTQKEAIIHVLDEFGGRANLKDVYPRVIKLAVFKKDSDKKATIRTTLQRHPELFRQSPGKKGSWEFISYQEEVATLKKRVEGLEKQVELLLSIPKEAEFIDKFLKEVMHVYKHDRMKADPIRIVLRNLGHKDAAEVLDAWIDEKEAELKKALEKLKIQIRNITMTGNDVTYNENNDNDKDE